MLMDILGIPLVPLVDEQIKLVNKMIDLRIKLKAGGEFQASDDIRENLQSLGYVLQDVSAQETQWYKET